MSYTFTGNLEGPWNGGYCGPWKVPGVAVESFKPTITGSMAFGSLTSEKRAQSFQLSSTDDVKGVVVMLRTFGTPTDSVRAGIQADSGGDPSGTFLASATLSADAITDFSGGVRRLFEFSSAIELTGSTTYWIVLERTGSLDASNYYGVSGILAGGYANGNDAYLDDGTWTHTNYDLWFQIIDDTETLFVLGVDYSNHYEIEIWKSTSPQSSWSECDASNKPVQNSSAPYRSIASYVEHDPSTSSPYDQYGALIHIVAGAWDSGASKDPYWVEYHSFDPFDQVWVTTEEAIDSGDSQNETAAPSVFLTVWQDGRIVVGFRGAPEKLTGVYYHRIDYSHKLPGGSWSSPAALDNGGTVNYWAVQGAPGANNLRTHFGVNQSSADQRTVYDSSGTPTLGTFRTGPSSNNASVALGVSDGTKFYIPVAGGTLEATCSDDPAAIGSVTDRTNESHGQTFDHSRQQMAIHGTDIYFIYVNAGSPNNAYYNKNQGASDIELVPGTDWGEVVGARHYSWGGANKIGFLLADNSTLQMTFDEITPANPSLVLGHGNKRLLPLLVR